MSKSILIAEDEKSIAESLSYCLQKEGFDVYLAHDGKEALRLFNLHNPSLILLDLMLPEINGVEVCKSIRRNSLTPIIMLTAKDSELDKIIGLENGADDYITKPFSIRELIARINAVLRRTSEPAISSLTIGPFHYDQAKHEISFKKLILDLPLKQFNILKLLLENHENVVTRKEIISTVWGDDFFGDEKTLDVHIRRLRQQIEMNSLRPKYLKTVRGVGYKITTVSK